VAQKAGIDGGGVVMDSGQHLKNLDAERYGELRHPGDAFAFDIFSQAGRAIGAAGGPLGDLEVERVLAVGESQSAMFLVTYINAVDPHDAVYDGFLVHGRGASGPSLDGRLVVRHSTGDHRGDIDSVSKEWIAAHRIRADARVPVINVQSETDVVLLRGIEARQPDHDRFRLWEIAGAAHFDTYGLLGSRRDDGTLTGAELASLIAPTDNLMGFIQTPEPINSGPQQHYVIQAALAHLKDWAGGGSPPPAALRLETGSDDDLTQDDIGIARGGIRTPWVDVPLAILSGLPQPGELMTALFGSTRPLDAGQRAGLYPHGREQYLAAFEAALDRTIGAGFILFADREEIMEVAAAGWPDT
jgi:Alpha/beta hydrolase domain